MKKIIIKITSMIMALTLVQALPASIGIQTKADDLVEDPWNVTEKGQLNYSFDNSLAGYAAGTVSIQGVDEEELDLYWTDSQNNKLTRDGVSYSKLGTMTITEGSGSYTIANSYTAIPEGAVALTAYSGDEVVSSYSIPENKQFNLSDKKYSFGTFSDIHYNRYVIDDTDYAVAAFDGCLDFMENTAGVTFVAGIGDLSKNSEESAYKKYKAALDKHKNLLIYTCMGNHDVYSVRPGYWKKYINIDIAKSDAKSRGILQVSDNGLNFVYQNPSYKDEVFVFVSQNYWRGVGVVQPLMDTETLNWLKEMLATYSDKTVYLMFHTYLSDANGDVTKAVGNLLAPDGYTYDLTYPVGTSDDIAFKALMKKYSNVTMLSGHSHWSYAMQEYNSSLNIGNLGSGATLVHVSSVGDPREVLDADGNLTSDTLFPDDSTARVERAGLSSEAMVVDVYDGYNVYNGVETMKGEYLAYATYIAQVGAKTTPESMAGPAKTRITKVTRANKYAKKIAFTWKKIKGATKYELQYSTSKKFSKATTKTTGKTTMTIKGLKAGKTYYVRVRSYKIKYGRKRYSAYSLVKKIVVKKATAKKK